MLNFYKAESKLWKTLTSFYVLQEYMQCVTSVDGHWLAELGPMFFAVKETGRTRLDKKKDAIEHLRDMEAEMKEAQEEIRAKEEALLAQEQNKVKRYDIATPGRAEPNTPRRVPTRFGL